MYKGANGDLPYWWGDIRFERVEGRELVHWVGPSKTPLSEEKRL